ncbi:MAG: hypothetical protein MUE84_05465 [Hyphomonas sp.]|jgi:hypothetical protein|nr:hypothetical protein [Hyphomonas sp.]
MSGVVLAVLLGVAIYAVLLLQTDRSQWMDADLWRSRRDVAAVGTAILVGFLIWGGLGSPPGSDGSEVIHEVLTKGRRRNAWIIYVAFSALGALVPLLIHLVVIAVRSRMGRHGS